MTESTKPSGNDVVAAWVLYGLQIAGELALAPFWLMSIMMGDSCGSVADEPAVCNTTYFFTAFSAFAVTLAIAAIAVPVLIVVAGRRGKRRWTWPALAIVLLALATAVYLWVMTR